MVYQITEVCYVSDDRDHVIYQITQIILERLCHVTYYREHVIYQITDYIMYHITENTLSIKSQIISDYRLCRVSDCRDHVIITYRGHISKIMLYIELQSSCCMSDDRIHVVYQMTEIMLPIYRVHVVYQMTEIM